MNPFAIIAFLLAIIVGFYLFFGQAGIFGSNSGPIATGPGSSSSIQNPQPANSGGFSNQTPGAGGSGGARNPAPPPRPGESPYKGKIRLGTIQRSSASAREEYISLRYGGDFFSDASPSSQRINVSGWKITSIRSTGVIPRAFNIAEIDAVEQDVIITPGSEVIVISGTPDYVPNFRENACTAYFNQTKIFSPSLSNSCIDESRSRTRLLNLGFSGACIDAIQSIPSCTRPTATFNASVYGPACVDYMVQHLSYVGCVADYRDRKDFLKNTWHVSLKQGQKMFDTRHDRVKLYDQNDLLVDEFEY